MTHRYLWLEVSIHTKVRLPTVPINICADLLILYNSAHYILDRDSFEFFWHLTSKKSRGGSSMALSDLHPDRRIFR
ncbi:MULTISPECIES: hypothetical protein [unclassified Chamaesiphon]|uniref:hypothetical protein n=1 Tax=unclassified Chamaesiphon TaxID=2620921 RepID=UPI00286A7B66|nr:MULTISPECIES: hypothetical protein [unclassified Chamaesiphon]